MYCPRCGAVLAGDGEFCHKCGSRIPAEALADAADVIDVRPSARRSYKAEAAASAGNSVASETRHETGSATDWTTLQGYFGGTVMTALLAAALPLLMLKTAEQQLTAAANIANGGALVISIWTLIRWPWLRARNWFVKVVVGFLLVVPVAVPVRLAAFVGAVAAMSMWSGR